MKVPVTPLCGLWSRILMSVIVIVGPMPRRVKGRAHREISRNSVKGKLGKRLGLRGFKLGLTGRRPNRTSEIVTHLGHEEGIFLR